MRFILGACFISGGFSDAGRITQTAPTVRTLSDATVHPTDRGLFRARQVGFRRHRACLNTFISLAVPETHPVSKEGARAE